MKNRNIKFIHDIINILLTLVHLLYIVEWHVCDFLIKRCSVRFFTPSCGRAHVLFMLLRYVCLQWCPMRVVSCKRQELLTLRENMGSPPVIDFFGFFFLLFVFALICVPSVSGLPNLDCPFGFVLPSIYLNITSRWFWCILQIFFYYSERKPFFFHNRSNILIQKDTWHLLFSLRNIEKQNIKSSGDVIEDVS